MPSPDVHSPPRARRHAVWALVSLAYLYVFPYFERLNNPNENVRTYMTRALVEHHTFAINRVEAEWGWVNDKARNGDRLYSGKAPGASLLGVPVLAAQTWLWHAAGWPSPSKRATTLALRLFATALPIVAFLFAFARYVERRWGSPAARDMAVLALGLGTMFYPYGVHFVGHAVAAALTALAFLLLTPASGERPGRRAAALAGLAAGAAVVFEYQNLLAFALLVPYAAVRGGRRALLPTVAAFCAGALLPAAILGGYHAICFGKPWAFPYGHLENPEFQNVYHQRGFHGLATPKLNVLGHIAFAPDYGLFAFSPFLLFGLAGAVVLSARRPRSEGVFCLILFLTMVLFLMGLGNWRGGWPVGPRYIAVVVPFLVLAAVGAVPRFAGLAGHARWGERTTTLLAGAASGLVVVGVVLNVLSGAVFPHFPPQLRNPVFQLVVPLLRQGYVPYNLGQWLGLGGVWSLLPLLVIVAAAIGLALSARITGAADARPLAPAPAHPRALVAALALAIAALTLGAASVYARRLTPDEAHAVAFARSIWEPRRWEPPRKHRAASPPTTPPASAPVPPPHAPAGPVRVPAP